MSKLELIDYSIIVFKIEQSLCNLIVTDDFVSSTCSTFNLADFFMIVTTLKAN